MNLKIVKKNNRTNNGRWVGLRMKIAISARRSWAGVVREFPLGLYGVELLRDQGGVFHLCRVSLQKQQFSL